MDGSDIRVWRRQRRVTQPRLAELLGVHAITVANWEREAYAIPPFLHLALEALAARLSAASPSLPASGGGEGEGEAG